MQIALAAPALQIHSGNQYHCALLSDRSVQCWGLDSNVVHDGGEFVATRVPFPEPAPVVSVVSATNHVCAQLMIQNESAYWCWGESTVSRTGVGAPVVISEPTRVELPAPIVSVDLSPYNVCVAMTNDRFRCWGLNHVGQVRALTQLERASAWPTRVRYAIHDERLPSLDHSEVLDVFSTGQCWCNAERCRCRGSMGLNESINQREFVLSADDWWRNENSPRWPNFRARIDREDCTYVPRMNEFRSRFANIRCSGRVACGWNNPNELYCWGDNHFHQAQPRPFDPSVPSPMFAHCALMQQMGWCESSGSR